jgi:hypothetical protein
MRDNYHITVQILESGQPIDHEWNKQEEGLVMLGEDSSFRLHPEEIAKVKYSIGMTINIGNYQGARVDVGIELPTHVDETADAYDRAVDFCNERLMEEVTNLQQLKKGKK